MKINKSSLFVCAFLITCLCLPLPINAGIISKPVIWISEKFGSSASKLFFKNVAKESAEKDIRYISRKFGKEAAEKVNIVASKTGLPKEKIAYELKKFGDVYHRAAFSEEAIEFGIKHGQAGRFFISRPELFLAMKKSGCLALDKEKVVNESWRLVEGNGGSWKCLRNELKAASMNGNVSRDFCEPLFLNRVKSGNLRDVYGNSLFPKGTELFGGHLSSASGSEIRQGIDFLLPEKNCPLKIIEFGTGKKPSDMAELSWGRIRKNLAELVKNSNNKDRLRAAGMPNELLNPANLENPNFPIHDFVAREIYAPEIDKIIIRKLERETIGSIKAIELP